MGSGVCLLDVPAPAPQVVCGGCDCALAFRDAAGTAVPPAQADPFLLIIRIDTREEEIPTDSRVI
jgi:hypothetical protein